MFDKVYFLGDIHGRVPQSIKNLQKTAEVNNEHYAVVLLGDVGANYYLDERDNILKNDLAKRKNLTFYCLRGNHERRPENCGCELAADGPTEQMIYLDSEFSNIKYLIDGKDYNFNGYVVLAIGGAYSADKFYRLSKGWHWFKDEQLTTKEMEAIYEKWHDDYVDVIISHTCPFEWQPTDLFLPEVDQNTVDNTMERWLSNLEKEVGYQSWLFGHFHDNRRIMPGVYMLSNDIPVEITEALNDSAKVYGGEIL
ncbi:MAG: metallophosphatase family protein [Lachnospiraceae bacterium]|nr:metallophosphatase family protein [Lachnospiraceae bacterium]